MIDLLDKSIREKVNSTIEKMAKVYKSLDDKRIGLLWDDPKVAEFTSCAVYLMSLDKDDDEDLKGWRK